MGYDFNILEAFAKKLMDEGNFSDAVSIYYFMADGDPSLDDGYIGHKIGLCYEKIGNIQAAKYWYGRAVEEKPSIDRYAEARKRLSDAEIEKIVK